jgi:murein DD-endopeptidase MepM/ murein hydrolase activator NlpD
MNHSSVNQTFHFIVLAPDTTPVKRFSISSRLLNGFFFSSLSLVLFWGGLLLYTYYRYSYVELLRHMQAENAAFTRLIQQLEPLVEKIQQQHLETQNIFVKMTFQSHFQLNTQDENPLDSTQYNVHSQALLLHNMWGNTIERYQHKLVQKLERLQRSSQTLQQRFTQTLEYLHDGQEILAHTPSIRPTLSSWITSRFGRRRDPLSHAIMMHKGIDLGNALGAPVVAPANGTVIWTGRRGGYGETVVLDHGFGLQTHFAHLSRILVKKGEKVLRGVRIAKVGSTGKSTGPHLHYEVRRMGQPLDPLLFMLNE